MQSIKRKATTMGNSTFTHPPVANGPGGFRSLTPDIDREQEDWETLLAIARTNIARLERERWERRRQHEERRNHGVEVCDGA
jgi:hypothetical protein